MDPRPVLWGALFAYLALASACAGVAFAVRGRRPMLGVVAGVVAFTLLCDVSLYVLHLEPVGADTRSVVLSALSSWLPFAAIPVVGWMLRSSRTRRLLLGVALAVGAVGIGHVLAIASQDLLGLVRIKFY